MECRGALGCRSGVRLLTFIWLAALVSLAVTAGGCFRPQRGDPVDSFHYQHTIGINAEHSHISISTYINRTQWRVGLRREDLYDGDRDGGLTTTGLDRVEITDYMNIEDPPERAVRQQGDIAAYDKLFREVLGEISAGKTVVKVEDRTYLVESIL